MQKHNKDYIVTNTTMYPSLHLFMYQILELTLQLTLQLSRRAPNFTNHIHTQFKTVKNIHNNTVKKKNANWKKYWKQNLDKCNVNIDWEQKKTIKKGLRRLSSTLIPVTATTHQQRIVQNLPELNPRMDKEQPLHYENLDAKCLKKIISQLK